MRKKQVTVPKPIKYYIYGAIICTFVFSLFQFSRAAGFNVLKPSDSSYAQTVPTPPPQQTIWVGAAQVVTQNGTARQLNQSPFWIGTQGTINQSYTALRFANISIPATANVESMQIEFTSTNQNGGAHMVNIYGENSTTPAAFATIKTDLPSKRVLTTNFVTYNDTTKWTLNAKKLTPELVPVLKPLVTVGSNASLNVIMKGTSQTKQVHNAQFGASQAPTLILKYRMPTPTVQPSPTQDNTKKIRVLELRYFPKGETDLIFHPNTLSANLQQLVKDASSFHKYSNQQAAPTVSVEVVKVINRYKARPNPDGTWRTSYDQKLAEDNLCQQIKDLNIDQVWEWVDPRTGYDTAPGLEYVISSKYFKQSTNPQFVTYADPMFCGGIKDFTYFSFDTSRTADLALHSIGHYMEGILGNVQSTELFWHRFGGDNAKGFPRTERCGNVHFPPNGAIDYDYSNQTSVNTSCENWNPDNTGTKAIMTCARWGCTQEGYLKWWMQNMPNANNTLIYQGKKLPNWWEFMSNIDATIDQYASNATYYMNQEFLNPAIVSGIPEITNQSSARQNNGTQLSWQHNNPSANFIVLTAAYRAHNNPSARITSAAYGGSPLTFVRRDQSMDRSSEIWYGINPLSGDNTVNVSLSADAEGQYYTSLSINNVDTSNPIVTHDGLSGSGNTYNLTLNTTSSDLVLGVLSTYPAGAGNLASPVSGTIKAWSGTTPDNNIQSSGGLRYGTGSATTLQWTSAQAFTYSLSGVVINTIQ